MLWQSFSTVCQKFSELQLYKQQQQKNGSTVFTWLNAAPKIVATMNATTVSINAALE